jgi:hypothetical protein
MRLRGFRFGRWWLAAAAVVVLSLGGVAGVAATHVFDDVNDAAFYANDVEWLKDNNITTGCTATSYCPNDYVTRGEMAAFLHRTAGTLVAAGVHIDRDGSDVVIDRWFNNVNGVAPSLTGSNGVYIIDMGFDVSQRYAVCTVDTNWVDTRNANCAAGTRWWSPPDNKIEVDIWDPEGGFQAGEFNLLVH